ncbi:MAG: ABC transporter permease [Gammaproteobacteria bacterium]
MDGGLHAEELRRDAAREKLALLGLSLPALLLVAGIIIVPVGWLFALSFTGEDGGFSLEHYRRLAESRSYARVFWTTFAVSVFTTLACAAAGYPLAYLLSQTRTKTANLLMIAVLLPFWTSLLVRTYAWLVLLQRRGLVNRWGEELGLWDEPLALVHNMAGTLIGMAHIMLPLMILPLYAGMKSIPADYARAASSLGASPARAFITVFFPLSLPGLLAGGVIVFVLCLGFFVTPALLGGGRVIMVAMRMQTDIELFFNWGAASALGVVLLALTLAVLYAASKILKHRGGFGGQA